MTHDRRARTAGDNLNKGGPNFGGPEYERLPPRVWWLSAVMVLIGIVTFLLMSFGDRLAHGYLYLFFYSIPANTAISLFPHEPVLIYYGKFANLWISAAAASGGTLVAGYLDHRVFVPVLNYQKIISYKQSRFYRRATALFMKYPFATIVVTGFTPIPFFPFKFLCFSIHYPLSRYLTALVLARYPRYFLLAWVGAVVGIPTWILILSVVVIFGLYAIRGGPTALRRFKEWRRQRKSRKTDTDPTYSTPAREALPGDAVRSHASAQTAGDAVPGGERGVRTGRGEAARLHPGEEGSVRP